MSPRIGPDVLLREHETRMHDPRGMSAQSDKNVRWSRHGPPAVHQFCPWGTRGSPSLSFWLRPHAGWISRGNCDFVPLGVLSLPLSLLYLYLYLFLRLSLLSTGSATWCLTTRRIMKFLRYERYLVTLAESSIRYIATYQFCKRAIDVYITILTFVFIYSFCWNILSWNQSSDMIYLYNLINWY